jgi:hypothetical protein
MADVGSTSPGKAYPAFIRAPITQAKPNDLEAPENIITSVAAAKSIYYNFRFSHLARIELYAGIEGLFSGNPPYNPTELASKGLSHITNYNNLNGRAFYEREALSFWNLINEAEYLAEFEVVPTSLFGTATGEDLVDWADTLSRHWDSIVRSWPSFNVVYNTLTGQLVKLGVSPVLWPDERDWRFRTIELQRFYVQDQAQCDMDLLTCVIVESVFTAQYLWEVYDTFKNVPKDECPWNIDELTALLLFFANQFTKDQYAFIDMMDIQRVIQNRDVTFNQIFTDDIRIASMLYKEYDGKVTHYMFHPRWDNGNFLYMADRQYKSMQEALVIFTASPGEFTIHSNRGLGHKVYSACQAMMQLDCSIVDMARMSATPLIKTLATGDKDFSAIRFYPGVPTLLGQAEFVENTLGANIQQLVGASQYVYNKIEANLSNSGDNPGEPDKSHGSLSPTQARSQDYKEFSILKNNIAHFYSLFTRVIQNMVVKMLNSKPTYPGYEYVEEWKRRCIQDGVPEEIFKVTNPDGVGLPAHLKVKATRVAGDGSNYAKLLGLESLLPISQSFGPKEEAEYKKQWIIATMGPQYVRAFMQDSLNAENASGGASLAGVENAAMQGGFSPVFSPDNEHRAHFTIHLALGNDIIRRIQQQQLSAVDADRVFTVLIPHMQEHFEALEKNIFAKQFVEQMKRPWDELHQYAVLNRHNAAKEIQANIKKQQALQAKNQQVLSKEQLDQLSTQAKIDDNRTKMQASIENQKEANQNRAENEKERIQLDAENKRLATRLNATPGEGTVDDQEARLASEPLATLRQNLADINGQSPAPYDLGISD